MMFVISKETLNQSRFKKDDFLTNATKKHAKL